MKYYVTGTYNRPHNTLDIMVFSNGQIIGEHQVALTGDLHKRHPLVIQEALRDITKNELLAWAQNPEQQILEGNHAFGPHNTRITIKMES